MDKYEMKWYKTALIVVYIRKFDKLIENDIYFTILIL